MRLQLRVVCSLSAALFSAGINGQNFEIKERGESDRRANSASPDQTIDGLSSYDSLGETLTDVPGLQGSGVMTPFQNTGFFLRGEGTGSVKIFVDGIPYTDPTSPNRGVDLSQLPLTDIESIDVYQGPQLQGMGGAIYLKSHRPFGPTQLRLLGELTSRRGQRVEAGTSRGDPHSWFSMTALHQADGGPSLVNPKNSSSERDRSSQLHLMARAGERVSDTTQMEWAIRARSFDTDTDTMDQDDPNFHIRGEGIDAKVSGIFRIPSWNSTECTASVNASATQRFVDNKADGGHDLQDLATHYDGTQRQLFLSSQHPAVGLFSFDVAQETMDIRDEITTSRLSHHQETWGISGSKKLTWNPTSLLLQVRGENGDRATGRVRTEYALADTAKVFGTVGTSTQTPSLYQRYSEYGNSQLRAERAYSADVGVAYHDRYRGEMTLFINDARDRIDFDTSTSRYANIGRTRTAGVEVLGSLPLTSTLQWTTQVTRQEAKNFVTHETLPRRATIFGSTRLDWKSPEGHSAKLALRHVGRRTDVGKKLPAFSVVDADASYTISAQGRVYLAIKNLLDLDYEEVTGFSASPRWALLGTEWIF